MFFIGFCSECTNYQCFKMTAAVIRVMVSVESTNHRKRSLTAVNQCFCEESVNERGPQFCPQLKDIQFTLREEERNQKIFTFKKLKSENFPFFFP